MAARLGAMQLQVLRFIRRYQQQYDDAPSVREICDACGLGSTTTGMYHLTALETKWDTLNADAARVVAQVVRRLRMIVEADAGNEPASHATRAVAGK